MSRRRTGSSTNLPRCVIRIRDTHATCSGAIRLLANAPAPQIVVAP